MTEIDLGAMRAAAAAARSAADQIRSVDLAGSAERLGSALPGSQSAEAAPRLAASWARGTHGWAQAAAAHGDGLEANANDAGQNDRAGQGHISSALEPSGG